MTLRWSAEAQTQLRELRAFIAAKNPRAARLLVEAIRATAQRLMEHPLLGHPVEDAPARVLGVPRTPYRLYYAVIGADIFILSVWHGARQWPPASD